MVRTQVPEMARVASLSAKDYPAIRVQGKHSTHCCFGQAKLSEQTQSISENTNEELSVFALPGLSEPQNPGRFKEGN